MLRFSIFGGVCCGFACHALALVIVFRFDSNFGMDKREEDDFASNKQPPPPPPQPEASSPAAADFPARKLVRQLDFTGFSASASSVENPQLRQPAAQQPQLAQSPPIVFMTMQQPPPAAAPPAQHSIRSVL